MQILSENTIRDYHILMQYEHTSTDGQRFADGFTCPRDRALFGICLFTGCRVSEALALQTTDIKGQTLTFRLFYHHS